MEIINLVSLDDGNNNFIDENNNGLDDNGESYFAENVPWGNLLIDPNYSYLTVSKSEIIRFADACNSSYNDSLPFPENFEQFGKDNPVDFLLYYEPLNESYRTLGYVQGLQGATDDEIHINMAKYNDYDYSKDPQLSLFDNAITIRHELTHALGQDEVIRNFSVIYFDTENDLFQSIDFDIDIDNTRFIDLYCSEHPQDSVIAMGTGVFDSDNDQISNALSEYHAELVSAQDDLPFFGIYTNGFIPSDYTRDFADGLNDLFPGFWNNVSLYKLTEMLNEALDLDGTNSEYGNSSYERLINLLIDHMNISSDESVQELNEYLYTSLFDNPNWVRKIPNFVYLPIITK